MDVFESANNMEKYLRQKCANNYVPFSGGLELTAECNMDCKFCYVHQNKNNRQEMGRPLTSDQWIKIIDQAANMGLYSLLITGGEPLLYSDFRKLYAHIAEKGIVITLNSNGTLMDESWIAFFKRYGCRRFNISLYGTDNETYEKLCGLKDGFDRVIRTLKMLKAAELSVRISVSVVPQNFDQIDEIQHIGNELNIPVQFTSYMFPATRRGKNADNQYRLSPQKAAEATVRCFHMQNYNADYEASCRFSLSKMAHPASLNNPKPGFMCYAAKSNFWLAWNGEMRPCGLFSHPQLKYNLLEHSFADCWKAMVEDTRNSACKSKSCSSCKMRDLCYTCPAACYAETGEMDGKPSYLCEMTKEIVSICERAVERANASKPLVSVIIPVYNAEKYLKRCIDSFMVQSMQQFELILVDDGSNDSSLDVCQEYASLDSRIHVIHQDNSGVSAARNAGIRQAQADYITFCDSDDFVEKNFLMALYEAIEKQQDAFVMSNVWAGNENHLRKLTLRFPCEDANHIPIEEAKNYAIYAFVWNKIYRKDIIERYNVWFDENISYNEDYLFNEKYIAFCKEAVLVQQMLCVHLTHEEGLAFAGRKSQGAEGKNQELDIFLESELASGNIKMEKLR